MIESGRRYAFLQNSLPRNVIMVQQVFLRQHSKVTG